MSINVLDGILVLDLSQFLSGPRCTQLMALKGARVIKIEPPQGETMRLLSMAMGGAERVMAVLHQNKKGIVLDLKKEEGKELFKRLVKRADVVVENLAPGTMNRMELGYNTLKSINPRLIYASITGFGQTGPYRERVAFDIISQATGGSMSALEHEDRPPAMFLGDLISGAYAYIGILESLISRSSTGKGQMVDISMQDIVFYHHFQAHSDYALEPVKSEITTLIGQTITNMLTDHKNPMAFWNSYKAMDGYVAIVAVTDGQWGRLMKAIGRDDLNKDPRFSNIVSRINNSSEAVRIMEEWTSKRAVSKVVETLDRARVPCGPVLNIDGLKEDPQLRAREMLVEMSHKRFGDVVVPGIPVKMPETPGEITSAGPDLGEHTEEVLKEHLGFDEERIKELRQKGAIN